LADIIAPCVIPDLPEADYHAHPSISKSGLWEIYTRTPAHYRFSEREEKSHFTLGAAAHCAILTPDLLETAFHCGPDDRRGNKWKDAQAYAASLGAEVLTSSDWNVAMRVRDAAGKHGILEELRTGATSTELSAFAHDPETGYMTRCRLDMRSADMNLGVDLKTTTDASPAAFAKSVVNYGYHAQEAHYSDVWKNATGHGLDGFIFVVIEKAPPYAVAVYELPPEIVAEGRAIIRKAFRTYAECMKADEWPAYPTTVQPLTFKQWAYRETEAPEPETV
jgi:hypothetical protein